MTFLLLDNPNAEARNVFARNFCSKFCDPANGAPKIVLGRNVYAKSIVENFHVDAIIDDFSSDTTFAGRPIIQLAHAPRDAMVVNAAGGRPMSAKRKLDDAKLHNIDYFIFKKTAHHGLLKDIVFNEGFESEFLKNIGHYEFFYERLADAESKRIFKKLVSFRFSLDMDFLAGFEWREDRQYFEEFLNLGAAEVFYDVGGFDGFTSLEFSRIAPHYKSIHLFEPDPDNYILCQQKLESLRDAFVHPYGLSNKAERLPFVKSGSASKVSDLGGDYILTKKMDESVEEPPTFVKIDVEGFELSVLEGARATIERYNPKLAVSVYHKPGDFWKVPLLVTSMCDNYDVFLRHYTESIYETVMFFVPR